MKTINSINSKINSINNEIDSLTIERRTLSNKRDEVSENRRDEIIFKIETLKDEKSKLRNELYEIERRNEKIKFGIDFTGKSVYNNIIDPMEVDYEQGSTYYCNSRCAYYPLVYRNTRYAQNLTYSFGSD